MFKAQHLEALDALEEELNSISDNDLELYIPLLIHQVIEDFDLPNVYDTANTMYDKLYSHCIHHYSYVAGDTQWKF